MSRNSWQETSLSTESSQDCGISELSTEALALVADFFKALSEVSRLQIICCLKSGQKNVTQIIEETGLGQANVSKHLKLLAQAGIVTREQQGASVFYQIANAYLFELCELVCDSLLAQMHQQNQHLEQLKALQQSF
ncbi:metalloregulator ArsR/SmtB family transcription factor [Lyngbya aestuarii]|uniref:metalloregulator ArsR/SmtB family transcription factor n=1 Tax=Lyngbya aestuarii TaxID=118322 RepID=UPI00403DD1C5